MVDHGGDNFLGGKDFDNALTDWAAARLAAEHGLPPFSRAERGHRRALAKLKAAAEQAKIDLSRAERAVLSCPEFAAGPDGAPLDADLPVTRGEFEALTAPLLERCVSVCLGVLEKNRLSPEAVLRVVFVGGPTLMPAVRERIGGAFGGRVAEGRPGRSPSRSPGSPSSTGSRSPIRPSRWAAQELRDLPGRLARTIVAELEILAEVAEGEWSEGDGALAGRLARRRLDAAFDPVQAEVAAFLRAEPGRPSRLMAFPLEELERWLAFRGGVESLERIGGESALATAWHNGLRLAACNWPVYLSREQGKDAAWAAYLMLRWSADLAARVGDEEIAALSTQNAQRMTGHLP